MPTKKRIIKCKSCGTIKLKRQFMPESQSPAMWARFGCCSKKCVTQLGYSVAGPILAAHSHSGRGFSGAAERRSVRHDRMKEATRYKPIGQVLNDRRRKLEVARVERMKHENALRPVVEQVRKGTMKFGPSSVEP